MEIKYECGCNWSVERYYQEKEDRVFLHYHISKFCRKHEQLLDHDLMVRLDNKKQHISSLL